MSVTISNQGDGRPAWRCECGCVNLAEFRKHCRSCGALRGPAHALDPYAQRERAHELALQLDLKLTCDFEGWKHPRTSHDWKCDDILDAIEDRALASTPSRSPAEPPVRACPRCGNRDGRTRTIAGKLVFECGTVNCWPPVELDRLGEDSAPLQGRPPTRTIVPVATRTAPAIRSNRGGATMAGCDSLRSRLLPRGRRPR